MSPDDFNKLNIFDDATDNINVIKTIISRKNQEDGFYIVDIGDIINKHHEWITKIPKVAPHYGMSSLWIFSLKTLLKFASKEFKLFTFL